MAARGQVERVDRRPGRDVPGRAVRAVDDAVHERRPEVELRRVQAAGVRERHGRRADVYAGLLVREGERDVAVGVDVVVRLTGARVAVRGDVVAQDEGAGAERRVRVGRLGGEA